MAYLKIEDGTRVEIEKEELDTLLDAVDPKDDSFSVEHDSGLVLRGDGDPDNYVKVMYEDTLLLERTENIRNNHSYEDNDVYLLGLSYQEDFGFAVPADDDEAVSFARSRGTSASSFHERVTAFNPIAASFDNSVNVLSDTVAAHGANEVPNEQRHESHDGFVNVQSVELVTGKELAERFGL